MALGLFTVLERKEIPPFLVARLKFSECHNFNGEKIIVWEGAEIDPIRGRVIIDPQFREGANIVAMFEPTQRGWAYALKFCEGCSEILITTGE